MQPMVFSPFADVFVVLPHDKDICKGGEYHRLHVQFRPPDDGPVRPETCRGKKIADIVRKKKQCIKLEIKNKKKAYHLLYDCSELNNKRG